MRDGSTLLLDFGGILYALDYPRMRRELDALDADGAYARLFEGGFGALSDRLEIGAITTSEFHRGVSAILGKDVPPASIDAAYNSLLVGLLDEAPDFLRRIREKHRVALVSNTNVIHAEVFLGPCAEFLGLFDRVYLSHEIGLRKPHASIYEAVLADLGADAGDAVFVDDLEENRAGARRVGIRTVAWATNQGIAGLEDAIEAAFGAKVTNVASGS